VAGRRVQGPGCETERFLVARPEWAPGNDGAQRTAADTMALCFQPRRLAWDQTVAPGAASKGAM
jgi:hypothetical protein